MPKIRVGNHLKFVVSLQATSQPVFLEYRSSILTDHSTRYVVTRHVLPLSLRARVRHLLKIVYHHQACTLKVKVIGVS